MSGEYTLEFVLFDSLFGILYKKGKNGDRHNLATGDHIHHMDMFQETALLSGYKQQPRTKWLENVVDFVRFLLHKPNYPC